MEVCEGTTATYQSDMGLLDADTVFVMRGTCGHSLITMERSVHIGLRDAKVSEPLEGADAPLSSIVTIREYN